VSDVSTQEALDRFNQAFGDRNVEAVMAAMTENCVFESTDPPPDGRRYEGQAAVRAYWEEFFGSTPVTEFTSEDSFVAGDRALVRWSFSWGAGHVRGVDVFRFQDGKVAEKLSYVKG
jgi:ketosteroid isomerase-like protein